MEKEKRRKKKLITELKKNECLAEGKKKTKTLAVTIIIMMWQTVNL